MQNSSLIRQYHTKFLGVILSASSSVWFYQKILILTVDRDSRMIILTSNIDWFEPILKMSI